MKNDDDDDIIARLDALSSPKTELPPSPDILGSVDALSERFANLFNRPPVASSRPLNNNDDDDIDPKIYLSQIEHDEDLTMHEQHKWKELDDDEFAKAMSELSQKAWELNDDDLKELEFLEATAVVEPGHDPITALSDLSPVDRLDRDARDALTAASKLTSLSPVPVAEKADAEDEEKPKPAETDVSEKQETESEKITEEMSAEERDISEQADRLVRLYASMSPDSNIPEPEEKDSDDEADELVDMYARLPSDDDNDKETEDEKDDDLFARLQALKSPTSIVEPKETPTTPTHSTELDPTPPTIPAELDLPTAPSAILPSVPTSKHSKKLIEDAELGCCMCSNDVEYRCKSCEKLDEDYLYCSKCFLLSHLSEQAGYDERSHRYTKFRL